LKKSTQDAIAGIKDPKHLPPSLTAQLTEHYREVTTLTYKLQEYGYAPYFAVVTGSLLSLQLAVALRLPHAEILSLFENVRKYFSDATINDPTIQPETIQVTQAKTKAEEATRWDFVTKFPHQGYLGSFEFIREPGPAGEPPQTGSGSCYLKLLGTIPPNKSIGFRYTSNLDTSDNDNGNDRRWASYPAIVGYSEDLDWNGRKTDDAVARVLGLITNRLADRDDSWERLGKLNSVLSYNEQFLRNLDDFKKKIPKT
jgi:hypothetical protein